jgi:hypothetical protein
MYTESDLPYMKGFQSNTILSFGASEGCVVIENLVTSVEVQLNTLSNHRTWLWQLAKAYLVISGVELDLTVLE